MKKIKNFFYAFFTVILMISCEEEDNLDPIGQWELSEPEFLSSEANLALDEANPTETYEFEWEPAISSARYQVRYTLVLDTLGSENYNTPLLSKASGNGGRETTASFTAAEIDLALSYAGFSAGEDADIEIAVIATSINKQTTDVLEIAVTRFKTEYKPQQLFLTGAGTEAGTELASAIPFRALKDADGNHTYRFEAYTHLEAGENFRIYSSRQMPAHVYGGSDGQLVKNGEPLTVSESGEYRLTVDLEAQTYELLKINKLSIVGDVIPNGWGGDEPLEYQGNGVWQRDMYLQVTESGEGGFVLRLNEDWGYLFKRITGTQDRLYMESQAEAAGISIENIPLTAAGNYDVTVTLVGDNYTYSLERDQTSTPPSETPENLYLLSNGITLATFEKDENIFTSGVYLPLQAEMSYQLNSAEDGSGTFYSLQGVIGESTNPDGDAVTGNTSILEGEGDVSVSRDQAYMLNFDFETGVLSWKYYNMKLFHWDDAGGGWEDRDEFLMTYVHPHQFTTTQDLEAGYAMKFNSPWDIQFGADDPQVMQGTMTNNGGENFQNITSSGTYTVDIEVSNTYEIGTYEFIEE